MMKKKKVAIIGTNGIPSHYGGFETLAEYLSQNLNQDYDLYCYCAKTPKHKQLKEYQNTKLIYLPFKANGWQSMLYDAVSIIDSLFKHDVLVILGFSGVFAFPFQFIFRKKIVFNIGGIEWQKVRGKKFSAKLEVWAKKWFEYICVKSSDVVIADNQVIYDYVVKRFHIQPVLAEYGGDHAVFEPIEPNMTAQYPFLNSDYDLTVSRAQEDMNIHLVIEAYKRIPHRTAVIISNWQISEYGKALKAENKDKYKNIILLDAIYDLKVLNTIRSNCKIYLHTHSLCGTAPSLTEAMSLKLPVICFDVPTNRATTEEKSLYFGDIQSLIAVLKELSEPQIKQLSNDMYEIAARRYTWERIVELYKQCIEI
ncbi:rhamnosyltransferase [Bacteroidia bacterium]|nr:rhamnosyltransferase [Bacteroidia bacterium]